MFVYNRPIVEPNQAPGNEFPGEGRPTSDPEIIDLHLHGRPRSTAAFLIPAQQPALVETGPGSTLDALLEALADRVDTLAWIVLTHVHLDHAGATGALARRYPEARVAVHRRGAPHLTDPSRLWASASRLYGDQMIPLWGSIDPIPIERLRPLDDGDVLDLGDRTLRVVETVGHASHHHAFLDDATGIAFAGDAIGIQLPGAEAIRPTTPPPEFDPELASSSIERLRRLRPAALWPTHFGPATVEGRRDAIEEICDRAIAAVTNWGDVLRPLTHETDDAKGLARMAAEPLRRLEQGTPEEVAETLEATNPRWLNAAGFRRYFEKLARSQLR